MNGGTVRWALTVPLLVYATAVGVRAGPPGEVVVVAAAVAMALPLVEVVTDRTGLWSYFPAAAVLGLLIASGAGGFRWAPGKALLVGLLLGAPLGLAGGAWRARASSAWGVLLLVGALAVALFNAAVAQAVGEGSPSTQPASWVGAAGSVLQSQRSALVAFSQGSPIPPGGLTGVPDVAVALLALVALVGFFATWLLPARGRPRGLDSEPEATGAEAPWPVSSGHAGSLAVAVAAVLAFEGAAAFLPPGTAVVGLCLGVAVALGLLALVGRGARLGRRGRSELSASPAGPAR